METRIVTPVLLSERLGSPPQYGTTAAEVLKTSALIAEAEKHWEPDEVDRFQDQAGIHEKVWGRLLAIHRCDRWQHVDQSELPGNYTAVYAITTLSDEAWKELLNRNMLSNSMSSRQIADWESLVTSGQADFDRRMPLSLAFSAESTIEEVAQFIREIKDLAQGRGMSIAVSAPKSREYGKTATPEKTVKKILKILIPKAKTMLSDAGRSVRETLDIQDEEQLLDAPLREFLKFLNRTAGSSAKVLESYPYEYCLKLALEFNRMSNTRANRFNYKKKLEEIASGDQNLEVTRAAVQVIRDFVE
jgi:hypothetical protein